MTESMKVPKGQEVNRSFWTYGTDCSWKRRWVTNERQTLYPSHSQSHSLPNILTAGGVPRVVPRYVQEEKETVRYEWWRNHTCHSLCTLPRWPRSFCPFHCHRVTVTRSSDSRLSDTEHGGRNHVSDRRGPWECETRVHSFLTRVVPPLVGRNEWLKGVNDVRRVGLRWLPAVTHLVACHAASHFVRRRRWQKKD